MKLLTNEKLISLPTCGGIIDTHIHLDSQAYRDDLGDCIERAQRAGVSKMLLPSTNLDSSRRIIELIDKHEEIAGAIGIHPHQAAEFDAIESPKAWRELLNQGQWSAIGETGLECHYDFCPLETQETNLNAQLKLAADTGLPVILHCRMAENHLHKILSSWNGKLTGVVHCFTGGWDWAQRFLDLGFYIGIGGLVTHPKASEVHQVAEKVPFDRWLLETDGPYLSPVPFRGFRNESCLLPLIAERIAQLRGQSMSEVVHQSTQNASRLFGM